MADLRWLNVVADVLKAVELDSDARELLYDRIHDLTAYRQARAAFLRGGSEQAARDALGELLVRLGIEV